MHFPLPCELQEAEFHFSAVIPGGSADDIRERIKQFSFVQLLFGSAPKCSLLDLNKYLRLPKEEKIKQNKPKPATKHM